MDHYLGTILPVSFKYPPSGWMLCNGADLFVDQYQALSALIGNTYGGDRRQFSLPDLQGRTPLCAGMADTKNRLLGESGGKDNGELSTYNIPAHTHLASFEPTFDFVPVWLGGVGGSQTATVKLEAQAVSGVNQFPKQNDHLAGSSSGGVKSYVSTNSKPVELAGVSVSISGQASIPQMLTEIKMVTGGSVTLGFTGYGVPFPIHSPYLTINFIICVNGLYPSQ